MPFEFICLDKRMQRLPMAISEVIAKSSISFVLDLIKPSIKRYLTKPSSHNIEKAISDHLIEIANWSSNIQFYGMSKAKNINTHTIKLRISDDLKKFTPKGAQCEKILDETFILTNENNHIITGPPGSGKTTTLKRICQNYLFKEPTSDNDIYQYPVLILFREYNSKISLYKNIANIYGVKYQDKEEKDADGKVFYSTVVEDERIEKHIPKLLDSSKAILLLDGLDEIETSISEKIESEIELLAKKLRFCKIVITCRSGYYRHLIKGFDLLEILPLDLSQIEQIAKSWITDSVGFISGIKKLPFFDTVDRPLLLCQLLMIYEKYERLPEKPSLVYKKAISLLLEEWDADRRIRRISKYSKFDPEVKISFLSSLSFHLTYKIKTKVFSEQQLLKCYEYIYNDFNLPPESAKDVINEIETHNGIISATYNGMYEFSHLSLQEYLCAEYLVRCPFTPLIRNYIEQYQPPIAIAVALSSEPSIYLAFLILKYNNLELFKKNNMKYFLSRVIIERPSFKKDLFLGLGILTLMGEILPYDTIGIQDYLKDLLRLPGVLESVMLAIKQCKYPTRMDGYKVVELERNFDKLNDDFFFERDLPVPRQYKIEKNLLDHICTTYDLEKRKIFDTNSSNQEEFWKFI